MRQKKEYRSAIRSRRAIRQAFEQLLQEKEFDKITVTDIVNRADINRSTFYSHYADVQALLEEIENEILQLAADVLGGLKTTLLLHNPDTIMQALSRSLQDERSLYGVLATSGYADRLDEKLSDMLVALVMQDASLPDALKTSPGFMVRVRFFVGGIMAVYKQFYAGKLNCSLKDAADEVVDVIQVSSQALIDTLGPE